MKRNKKNKNKKVSQGNPTEENMDDNKTKTGMKPDDDLKDEPYGPNVEVDEREEQFGHMEEPETFLDQMRLRIAGANAYYKDIHLKAREDINFIYGDQWDPNVIAERQNRPTMTMNLCPQTINVVVGKARSSNFTIDVTQISGSTGKINDLKYNKGYSKSQVMSGLIKDIEHRSNAKEHYARALQHAVEGGFGYLFISTKKNENDPLDNDLRIEHITDRWSVYIDYDAHEEDFSDARFCARVMSMREAEFHTRWPDKVPMSGGDDMDRNGLSGKESGQSFWNERTEGQVRVIDYWWRQPMDRVVHEFVKEDPELQGVVERVLLWEDEYEDVFNEMKMMGFEHRRKEKVNSHKIMYMRCTRDDVLDGPYVWPSKFLPIIPVIGRRAEKDGKEEWHGLFRHAKDSQRMVNFWTSAATEKVALAPKNPYMIGSSQIAGLENIWNEATKKHVFYLTYNDSSNDGANTTPPSRQGNTEMASGELSMLFQSNEQFMNMVGVHSASLGKKSNEVSGKAINARDDANDNGAYEFMDSLSNSVMRAGNVLVDMIPRIYSNDYPRRIVLPDDDSVHVDLNKIIIDNETGMEVRVHSIDYAAYSCEVTVAMNSEGDRERMVSILTEMARSDPEGGRNWLHKIVEAMKVPGSRPIAEILKRGADPRFLTQEEQQEIGPPPPTPEQELQKMQMETEQMKAKATIAKAEADIKIAEIRLQSDQVRLKTEIDRGDNRMEEDRGKMRERKEHRDKEGSEPEITTEQIEAIVKKTVAKELVAQKKKEQKSV